MVVKDPGSAVVNGAAFELAQDAEGRVLWRYQDRGTDPGPATPEEGTLSKTPASFARTIGFLDWSGGAGLATYRPGDPRFHWSEGPTGEYARRLTRPLDVRRVALTDGGDVTDFFEIAGGLWLLNGDYARKVTPTLNAETVATAKTLSGVASGDADGMLLTGAQFTEASPVWYDATSDKVFIGATGATILSFDGTAWAQDDDVFRTYWTVGRYTTGERLWASSADNGVQLQNLPQGQNPFTAGNWSVQFTATREGTPVTGIANLRDSVLVATQDGLIHRFPTDASAVQGYPLNDEGSATPSEDHGRSMKVWNGRLFVPTVSGLLEFRENDSATGGVFVAVGPEAASTTTSPVAGPCTALSAQDAGWLYAAFWNGTDSYVYKLRDGGAWQPVAYVAGEQVTALHVTRLGTNPILCAGTDNPAVHFVTLPRPGRTVFSDTNCRSETAARAVYLADHDAVSPATNKGFLLLVINSEGFSSTETLTVYARVDGGAYEQVATVTESPTTEIRLPASYVGHELGLRFDFAGTDNIAFPYVRGVEIHFVIDAELASWIDATLLIGADQPTASGLERQGVQERLEFLSLLAREPQPFEVTGPDGITYDCKIDRGVGVTRDLVAVNQSALTRLEWRVALRLNVYTRLLHHDAAVYEVSPYTQGGRVSYYDTT